jgi:hypothetical protein
MRWRSLLIQREKQESASTTAQTAIVISAVGVIVVGYGGLGLGILGITRPRDRQQDRAHVTGSETD